jgi:colanic acid biosynthesis glycosyl transferase WcaI
VILAMSPPIFFGGAARILATRFRAPFVFNVQDIFPDVAIDLGMLTNPKVISTAQRFERSLYASADAVTVLSQDQADNVRAKLVEGIDPLDRVRIIPNFVDTDRVKVVVGRTRYRDRHDLDDRLVVMYSGNVGFSQSFDLIERAAKHFVEADPRVVFVINGEGAARPLVEDWAADLPNVLVTDFAPRHEVSDVLGSADLQLILLAPGLARSSTPSKLYGILAAGRPVLASIDLGSDADRIIREAGAGVVVPPGEPAAFIEALESLLGAPEELERMGRRAHEYLTHLFTPDQQAKAYEVLFSQLTNR